jgi:hypothetical protein
VFIIPWIIALFHLYRKDRLILPLVAPFSSVIAFVINDFGHLFGFWKLTSVSHWEIAAALPFDMGLYPILASYMIYFIRKNGHPYIMILVMTSFTTLGETVFVYFGRVIYGNGWNNFWTFLSYLVPYILVYGYFLYLRKIVRL